MTATVQQLHRPDQAKMRAFLGALFEGFPEVSDGLVQIVHSDAATGELRQHDSRWFSIDELDEAAEWAARMNATPGQSVYFGAALRRPDCPAFGGASDDDFYALTHAYADFDDPGDDARAVETYKQHHASPTLAVITGRTPHRRTQMWWRLKEPITDAAEARALNTHLMRALGGDRQVVNPARLMRIAGSIAWPKPNKPDRVIELTELKQVSNASYHGDDARIWAMTERDPVLTEYAPREAANERHEEQDKEYRTEHHGLTETRVVVDGREKHARDIILRKLIDYIGENGAAPTEADLFADAWPIFAETTDLSRPGRGENFFRAKVRSTLYRFNAGRISGLADIDEAKAAYGERQAEREKQRKEPRQSYPQTTELNPTPYLLADPRSIPRRRWIARPHYQRQYTSITVAAPKVGKSSITMVEALSIATGRALLEDMEIHERVPVWVINLEDPREEIDRRFAGICKHYGITQADIDGYLYTDSGRTLDFRVVAQEWGKVVYPIATDAIIEAIQARNIGVLMVDPLVRAHRVPENDNGLIDEVFRIFAHIADVTGCAVELIHHPRKTMGQQVGIEDIRGGGSIFGAVRSARTINRITEELAETQGIEPHDRRRFVFVSAPESNMSLATTDGVWRELVTVDVGNGLLGEAGDTVGVATVWKPRHAVHLLTQDQVDTVLQEIIQPTSEDGHALTGRYSGSPKAQHMSAASMIATLTGIARKAAQEIVDTWLGTGVLVNETYTDPGRRKEKTGLFVNQNLWPGRSVND